MYEESFFFYLFFTHSKVIKYLVVCTGMQIFKVDVVVNGTRVQKQMYVHVNVIIYVCM